MAKKRVFGVESKFLALFVLISLVLAGFTVASFATRNSPTGQVLQDVVAGINISVNSTGPSAINITNITVTIPSGFNFSANSNRTTALSAHTFSNTSTVLHWNASGLLQNTSVKHDFLFNVTANSSSVNGSASAYNFIINMYNVSSFVNQTNFTLGVNDTAAPTVALARSSDSTATKLVVTVTLTDNDPSIASFPVCSAIGNSDATVTGTGASQTVTVTGLTCNTAYDVGASCKDLFNNTGSTTSPFTTDACSSSGGGSGGGGGTTTTNPWTNTFVEDSQEFSAGGEITKELAAKSRVRLKIDGETHYVGVKSLTTDSVVIEVSSNHEQEATLNVGQSKNFDVTSDGKADLRVTVVSISSSKATLLLTPITEEVSVSEEEQGEGTTDTGSATGEDTGSSLLWLWIVIIVIVVIAIIFFVVKRKK